MDGYFPNGKRKYKSFYGKTQKEVKQKVQEYRTAIDAGLKLDAKLTFEVWAEQWYAGHLTSISPTTRESYRYSLNILKQAFRNKPIMDIKPVDVERFLQQLRRDGKSDSTLAKCRGMFIRS